MSLLNGRELTLVVFLLFGNQSVNDARQLVGGGGDGFRRTEAGLHPSEERSQGGLTVMQRAGRHAERRVTALLAAKDFNPEILRYLNRLSDLCWVLARYVEKTEKGARSERDRL